ncbi:hypothetical protein [Stratiformator vulcanicus]|uniref:Uncharacterized protein n=1 Tax=Stratiformator vulcanicus TaxID=2527980 RepID=A0A517R414_9PLAN|nr:hypothetical protein [Stratiformator vulcanicus]QDT38606.1 hypothetical protein Pan189_30010 [Stratiformator vulcanicus]
MKPRLVRSGSSGGSDLYCTDGGSPLIRFLPGAAASKPQLSFFEK